MTARHRIARRRRGLTIQTVLCTVTRAQHAMLTEPSERFEMSPRAGRLDLPLPPDGVEPFDRFQGHDDPDERVIIVRLAKLGLTRRRLKRSTPLG